VFLNIILMVKNRLIYIFISILFLVMISAWVIYMLYGTSAVETWYYSDELSIIDNYINIDKSKPLDFHYSNSDKYFYLFLFSPLFSCCFYLVLVKLYIYFFGRINTRNVEHCQPVIIIRKT